MKRVAQATRQPRTKASELMQSRAALARLEWLRRRRERVDCLPPALRCLQLGLLRLAADGDVVVQAAVVVEEPARLVVLR